jgi:hypothetical protein
LDVLEKEAFARIARQQGGTAIAPGGQASEAIHHKAALILAGGVAVALEAARFQQCHGLLSLGIVRALDGRGADGQNRQAEA